jgi:hypothetical protein
LRVKDEAQPQPSPTETVNALSPEEVRQRGETDKRQRREMVEDAHAGALTLGHGCWSAGGKMQRLSADVLVRVCKNVGVRGCCCGLARTCKKLRDLSSRDEIWSFFWSQRHRMSVSVAILAPARAIGAPSDENNPGAVAVWAQGKVKTNVKAAYAVLHLTDDPLRIACGVAGCGVVRCVTCLDPPGELLVCHFCKAAFCRLHREVAPGIIGNCERWDGAGNREEIFLCTDCRPGFKPHCEFRSAA